MLRAKALHPRGPVHWGPRVTLDGFTRCADDPKWNGTPKCLDKVTVGEVRPVGGLQQLVGRVL